MRKPTRALVFSLLVAAVVYGGQQHTALTLIRYDYFQPSPVVNGMGLLGVALPMEDVYSFCYNPANFPFREGLSFSYSPYITSLPLEWNRYGNAHKVFGYGAGQIGFSGGRGSTGASLGYIHFREGLFRTRTLALSVHSRFRLGPIPLGLSLGGAHANIVKKDVELDSYRSIRKNWSFGVLAVAPISLNRPKSLLTFKIVPAFGYSVSDFERGTQLWSSKDRTWTEVRLGHSVTLELMISRLQISVLRWRYGREVESRNWFLDNLTGDINISYYLSGKEQEQDVSQYRGAEITLLGLFSLRWGKIGRTFQGQSWPDTKGMSIHAKPLFQLVAILLGSPLISGIAANFDLSYDAGTNWDYFALHKLTYASLTLTLNNLGALVRGWHLM